MHPPALVNRPQQSPLGDLRRRPSIRRCPADPAGNGDAAQRITLEGRPVRNAQERFGLGLGAVTLQSLSERGVWPGDRVLRSVPLSQEIAPQI
jgi:hypothetical protein